MDYLTSMEMSKVWGISSRRISLLCSEGRVAGAEKKGKTWLIPKEAKKPEDPRRIKKQGEQVNEQAATGSQNLGVREPDAVKDRGE